MRPARGCEACRERHVKCVSQPGDSACRRCADTGRTCHFGSPFRFKPVHHVDSLSHGVRARYDLKYDVSQRWLTPRRILNFILEDGSGLEYGVPEENEPSNQTSEVNRPAVSIATEESRPNIDHERPWLPTRPHDTDGVGDEIPWTRDHASRPNTAGASRGDVASPATISDLSRRHEDPPNVVAPSLTYSTSLPVGVIDDSSRQTWLASNSSEACPDISRREAYLLQHFIHRIAPWVDVCDLTCQFTHEVPRRAMQQRMVLFAVLAVSSRHLAILAKQREPAEASFYQSRCLRLAIEALSGPETCYDDNLLATVVCLRVYEELEHSTDEHLHLRGLSKLIAVIPDFAHSGGLAEAACWQSLRQDIYISLVHFQQPSLRLESFERSSVFTFRDDAACANVVILLFAKILRQTYTPEMVRDTDAWRRLESDVIVWNERRLHRFRPIYHEAADCLLDRPFPIIHMISPPQVAALQYYHACKVYLTLHKPADRALSGFHAAKQRRDTERDVAQEVIAIAGLAESNPFVENANFTALHLLRVAGYCITNSFQRQHVLKFLRHVESIMGWGTSMVVDQLRAQWASLDHPGD